MAQSFVIPYRALASDGRPRPYLVMLVTGVNGKSGHVIGLVDSGADTTCLPFGYASLMGYTPQMLELQTSMQVSGTTTTYLAKQPSSMFVPEIQDVVIDVHPLFVPGSQMVLWGRLDFMARFEVTLVEREQQFAITPYE